MIDLQLKEPVTGITSDTRNIKQGMVFVAVRGVSQDGHLFLNDAEMKGAVALVGEVSPSEVHSRVPYFQVADSALALAQLAAEYYQNPSHSLLVVGVTGTSGKTTTTYLLESILQSAGYSVGLIGTVSVRFGGQEMPSTHTTPGAVELQSILNEMKSKGCTAVVMEVSSHALKQKRVHGVEFDGMIFTNLSPEHLDYHPDMEDYFEAKAILFSDIARDSIRAGKKSFAAINTSDSYGKKLVEKIAAFPKGEAPRYDQFGTQDSLDCRVDGVFGEIHGVPIESALVGRFNASNIDAAVCLAKGIGIPSKAIEEGIRRLPGVPGRLERVANSKGVHIWVDYAHKPDALEKVIKTLRERRNGKKLITVFGCGGDRDRKKRPLMGQIAVQWSDRVWITSDNPRTEEPMGIISEILTGVGSAQNFTVQVDRRKAIFEAVSSAGAGDLVLIAGKGHEDYQIIGAQKIHFDDREVASEAIRY